MIEVVALALIHRDGRILMHRRKIGSEHGGLWEFPGGKKEAGESKRLALVREIREELGIGVEETDLAYLASAQDAQSAIVIDLYTANRWAGDPLCLEGEEIAWMVADELIKLDMPPLDVPLAQALIAFLAGAK